MAELDARKQTILRAIIIEYVSAAEPIASEMLTQKYALGVKSATIRNEMAEMAELGLLEQPHTSAGRIPSDLGYRYYVDRLVVTRELEEKTKQRLRSASASDGDALQAVLQDTVAALSRATYMLSAATTVRDGAVTVRNAILSALGPSQALLVLILSNGQVENRMVEIPVGLTLDDVGKANEALNAALAGKNLRLLSRAKAPAASGNPVTDKLLTMLWANVRAMAKEITRGMLLVEGEEFLFAQPEFQRDVNALTDLLNELTDSDVLYESLAPGEEGRTVTIGKEHRHEQMHQLSVIRHSFHVGGSEAGVIALVGPTRMRYEVGIPLVNYTARALSQSLTRFFG
jgi:heat-inducible transcriptional repressor